MNGGESGLELSGSLSATKFPSPDPISEDEAHDGGGVVSEPGSEVMMSPSRFSFNSPMDNIVVRGYQFSVM